LPGRSPVEKKCPPPHFVLRRGSLYPPRCNGRRLVGSAGNAPVRRFRLCFLTPDLQSGSRITSLGNW